MQTDIHSNVHYDQEENQLFFGLISSNRSEMLYFAKQFKKQWQFCIIIYLLISLKFILSILSHLRNAFLLTIETQCRNQMQGRTVKE